MTNAYRTLVVLLAAAASMVLCVSPALAGRGRVFGPSFGAPGSGAGQLSLVPFTAGAHGLEGGSGLGVDGVTLDVYVADTGNHRVDEFTSSGAFVRAWGWGVVDGASEFQICTGVTGCRAGVSGTAPGQFETPAFIAVDDSPGGEGDVYVSDFASPPSPDVIVQKFTAGGALIESWGSKGQINGGAVPAPEKLEAIDGVAVRPSGELVVGTKGGVFQFTQSSGVYIGRAIPSFATEFPDGIAMDGSGNYYIAQFTEIYKFNSAGVGTGHVFRVSQETFAATGLAVAGSGELYVDEGNAVQTVASSCVSLCAPTITFTSPQLTKGAGLAVDSQLETVYIAETAADKIESIIPEPPASPLVEAGSESVSNVSADSATLEAIIDPRSQASEEPTTYRFQYTTEERFQREGFGGASSIPVPDGQLTSNFEADPVSAHPQGLDPGTVYRYRVVAENAISRKEGKPTEGEGDETGKEIVHTFTTQTPGVFALPDGRAWELVSPPDKHGALLGALLTRGAVQAAAGGDAIAYLASAPTESSPPGNSNYTQVLSARGGGATSSWGSRDISTPRDSANGLGGTEEYRFFSQDLSLGVVQPFGDFVPSLSAEASEQTAFLHTNYLGGDPADPCLSSCYRPLVTGAPGFANVPEGTEFGEAKCLIGQCGPEFLGANQDGSDVVLTSKSAALTEGSPPRSLYEWAGGQLQLVSVLPKDQPAPTSGELELGSRKEGDVEPIVRNAISADGSRVVWSMSIGGQARLYVRDVVREETVELGGVEAMFQTASSDDSRVFFTAGGDLYVFEAPAGVALTAGHTMDLTPGANVQGIVPGASQDGSSVYFVATGALTGTEANAHGEEAVAGRPNLYLYHAGATRLVAVLSGEDAPDWKGHGLGYLTTARVSPDGEWLAFMSERSLTGYDNRDVSSGERDEEVFLYDAAGDGGAGKLVCASCNPTGARPHGIFDAGTVPKHLLVDDQFAWAGRWLAANVPAWTSPLYESRYLSDSGRLFFDSSDGLVPSDTNGTADVYQYEPFGVGGCTSDGAIPSAGSGGCVGLVSSGTAREESAFLDASESGGDVFFLTSAQLSPMDRDSTPDVYDARVGGGFPVSQPPPACEGDACQSPVAAPNDPTPGSLTYRGPGNPVPLLTVSKTAKKKAPKCAKGRKLSRGKCAKKSRKARKARKVGRATNTGRTSNKRGARS